MEITLSYIKNMPEDEARRILGELMVNYQKYLVGSITSEQFLASVDNNHRKLGRDMFGL